MQEKGRVPAFGGCFREGQNNAPPLFFYQNICYTFKIQAKGWFFQRRLPAIDGERRRKVMDFEKLKEAGLKAGFSHIGMLDCSTIELKQEVRDMCASGNCKMYGHNWACPPACGTLEECRERIGAYRRGILVQTVGELEDELDGEGMIETQERHMDNFRRFQAVLREEYPDLLALGAGGCTVCPSCAYPDAPCRFPDKALSSVESYGILVLQLCKDNHMEYYYGKDHIAYTSFYLLE